MYIGCGPGPRSAVGRRGFFVRRGAGRLRRGWSLVAPDLFRGGPRGPQPACAARVTNSRIHHHRCLLAGNQFSPASRTAVVCDGAVPACEGGDDVHSAAVFLVRIGPGRLVGLWTAVGDFDAECGARRASDPKGCWWEGMGDSVGDEFGDDEQGVLAHRWRHVVAREEIVRHLAYPAHVFGTRAPDGEMPVCRVTGAGPRSAAVRPTGIHDHGATVRRERLYRPGGFGERLSGHGNLALSADAPGGAPTPLLVITRYDQFRAVCGGLSMKSDQDLR